MAWIVVAVLWVAAFLNYFDRLLITSMRETLVTDVPMTNAQFGLLTTSFLWIYGSVSPFGGLLSDKFGRRGIILLSVGVWSIVTWWTGQAQTFRELLVARALMGISEACYVPAALALITDHHRGPTRSLATGLHISGMYAGAACGGLGGYLASHFGWRFGFSALGVIGVGYAVVASVFLCDAPDNGSPSKATPNLFTIRIAARSLLLSVGFWLLVVVFCVISVANWFIYGWLPTYLKQSFRLSEGAAGLSASVYIQVAALAGILLGGFWADRWSLRNPRARQWVAAAGFALAAPALFLTGISPTLLLTVLGLVLCGLGRGLFDANAMPVLRQIVPDNYSATGYGVMNFFGCVAGGCITYAAGWLLDSRISLQGVFFLLAVLFAAASVALVFAKPRQVSVDPIQGTPTIGV